MLTLELVGLALPVHRLLLILAIVVAWATAALVGRRERRVVGDVLWRMLWTGVLAARAVFVLQYWDAYRQNLLGIIDIRDGGFSLWAGIVVALCVAGWSGLRRPALRRPLAIAVSAGAMTWGSTTGALLWLNQQSRALPQLQLQTLQGRSISLPSLTVEPMVINLWASWCPPCRREMPMLEQAQHAHPQVTFVFVNQGEGAAVVRDYLQQTRLALGNVLLDPERRLGRIIGSTLMPTTLFYDADGKLVDSHLGMLSRATLRSKLSQLEKADSNAR